MEHNIENLKINLYTYDQLIDIGAKTINRERIVSLTNGADTTRFPYAKEWSWTPTSYHIQSLTQKGSDT